MGLRDILSPLRKHRRARNAARNGADPIEEEDPTRTGLATHPAGLGPGLETGSSTLPKSTPSTPQSREPNGMRTTVLIVVQLTILPRNADTVVSDPTQSDTRKGKRSKFLDRVLDRSTPASEDKSGSGWKSTAYESTKVVIDVVKESSDIFVPLKSAAGGLAAILKHYDVWPIPVAHPQY